MEEYENMVMPDGDERGLRLASFDGGGSRVSAQLFTLCHIMHRIRFERYRAEPDRVLLPCDYFDMMAGADFGGLVVIMLVVLRMSAEEARDSFLKICAEIYGPEISSKEKRTAKLRECVEDLLEERGHPPNYPLLINDPQASCHGFIVVTPTADARSTHKMLTYLSTSPPEGLSVVEAAMATCAAQTQFLPATVGPFRRQYFSAGLGFANPTRELLSEALSLFTNDRYVSAIVSFGSGHPGVLPLVPHPSSSHRQPYSDPLRFLQDLLEDCERTSQEILRETSHLPGIYFRFSVEQGFQGRREDFEQRGEFGTIASLVDAYLETHDAGVRLKTCVSQICSREGVTTLERLNQVGGDYEFERELPPLTSPFIMRQEPWSRMWNELGSIHDDQTSTRVIVITGLPGAGKTWLATRFAQDSRGFFSHVCFIGGQSEASIKQDLVQHARSKGGMMLSQATAKDALAFFRSGRAGRCLLFYDNVDKGDLDLVKLLPLGQYGMVIVTSRDRLKGELASEPHLHIELDMMTEEESIETIIQTSRLPGSTGNRRAARRVAQELGCLPVALAQAGTAMFRYGYSAERYLELYRTRRDGIPGEDKAYGAFDISGQRLGRQYMDFFHLMAFMHHSSFPMEAISLAAESNFEGELFRFTPREPIHQEALELLRSIFCRTGQWNDRSQSQMVAALQNCSLGSFTLAPGSQSLFFRMHPLIHKWAMDRMPVHRRSLFKEAATRLISCAVKDVSIRPRLLSHIDSLLWYSAVAPMHVNDRAVFGKVLRKAGRLEDAQGVWVTVRDELASRWDRGHVVFAQVNLEMAPTLQTELEHRRALVQEAVIIYSTTHGKHALVTLRAKRSLAETCQLIGDLEMASELLNDVLKGMNQQEVETRETRLETARLLRIGASVGFQLGDYDRARGLGEKAYESLSEELPRDYREVLQAAAELALTYGRLGRHADARRIQQEVLETAKVSLGESDEVTLKATIALAETYFSAEQYTEAAHLLEPAITLFQEVYGDVEAADTMILLVKVYMSQSPPRLSIAIDLQQRVIRILKENLGESHDLTLREMGYLALFYEKQRLPEKVERVLQEVVDIHHRRDQKPSFEVYQLMRRIATAQFYQKRYEDAMCLEVECLSAYIDKFGVDSVEVAEMRGSLAATYIQMDRKREAAILVEDAMQVFVVHLDTHAEEYQKTLAVLDQLQNPVTSGVKMAYQEFKDPIVTELDILRDEWNRVRSGENRRNQRDSGGGNANRLEKALVRGVSNVVDFFR